jgi:C1A family cysteine protease
MYTRQVSAIWMVSVALCLAGCGAPPDATQGEHSRATTEASALVGAKAQVRLPAALGGGTEITAFAPATPPLKKHGYGALLPAGDAAPDARAEVSAPLALPATADVSAGAPPTGDQGDTGSCTTWATGYSAMSWWANHVGLSGAIFAPMYLYSQIAKGVCSSGAQIENALDLLKSQGIDTQTDYEPMQFNLDCGTLPTSAQKTNAANFKITNYVKSDLSKGAKSAIMSVIAGGTPAIIALMVYPEFENANASNYLIGPPVAGDSAEGGHAVTAFAYDENGVWILNQWGGDWGNNGWAELSWDFVDGSFNGQANVYDVDSISGVSLTCSDSNSECGVWAFTSQCQVNPDYMLTNCCASCANPAPELSTSSAWYRIQNLALGSGYSLDTYVMNPSGNYTGQYWELSPLPNGRYRLTNSYQGDGISLDTTSGAVNLPEMATTGSYTGQFWTLSPITDGVYRLTNDFLGPENSLQADSDAHDVEFGTTAADPSQYWQISLIE